MFLTAVMLILYRITCKTDLKLFFILTGNTYNDASFLFFNKQKKDWVFKKIFSGICKRKFVNLSKGLNCLFKAKVHLVQKKSSTFLLKDCFLWKLLRFLPISFVILKSVNSLTVNIYIFCFGGFATEIQLKEIYCMWLLECALSWWQYFQLVSSFIFYFVL